MNIRKSTLRRLTLTAFLGAIAIGGILATNEAQATLPGVTYNGSYAYWTATKANERARSRAVEMQLTEVKKDRLGEFGIDHRGLGDTTAEAAPAKKTSKNTRTGLLARLRDRL